MRRFWGALLLCALAVPASLSLPSARVASGQSCAMACDHGDHEACCCAGGGATALRKCAPGDGALVPAPFARAIVPPLAAASLLTVWGWLALAISILLVPGVVGRPDPVPRLLSPPAI